jgi:hypothetical protein
MKVHCSVVKHVNILKSGLLVVLIHELTLWGIWILLLLLMRIHNLLLHHSAQWGDFIIDSADSIIVIIRWELFTVH